MLITSSVSLPLDTKDVSEAVRHVLDILCSKVSVLDKVEISLNLAAMSFPDVLALMAEALPKETEGFGMNGAVTAGQFIEAYVDGRFAKPSFCSCDVTDYISVSDTLDMIEGFLEAGPRALRTTSISIDLRNLDWRGAEGVGSGELHLFDLKAFQRKQRFRLSAVYSCHARGSKDVSVRTLLENISNQTGIAFDQGKITGTVEPETLAEIEPNEILAARICYEEAFEEAGEEIRSRNIKLDSLFGLASQDESFNRRMESVYSGRKERVNFQSMVRRFMKESLSEFKPWKGGGEQVFFSKPLSSEFEIVLGFDRLSFWGLGKAFALLLGVKICEGPLAGRIWDDSLFRLFRQRTFPPCWTYVTKVELARALNGIGDLLKSTLSIFERALARHLCPIPKNIPDSILDRGAITAKQGMEEAVSASRAWAVDTLLYSVSSRGILDLREGGGGAMITVEGFLQRHGCWCYCFYSPTKKRSFIVQVPSLGLLRCDEWAWSQPFGVGGETVFPKPIDRWIDSDRAMRIAEENGGRIARKSALENWDISAKLEIPPDRMAGARIVLKRYGGSLEEASRNAILDMIQAEGSEDEVSGLRWTVHYFIRKTKNRREDFEISFNAINGGDIRIHPT